MTFRMKKNLTNLATLLLILTLSACAGQKSAEQKVNREIKEVVIPKTETLAESAREFIMKSDKLTEDQKTKLLALQEKMLAENSALREEIEKSRIVLIKTVLEPKMNQREYSLLKKKITKLENTRLSNSFKAVTEARNIISPKKYNEDHEFYKQYFNRSLHEF
jgi:hypothetical protein